MCELIMVNEDLDKEIKSDNTFSKRSLKMAQRLWGSVHILFSHFMLDGFFKVHLFLEKHAYSIYDK